MSKWIGLAGLLALAFCSYAEEPRKGPMYPKTKRGTLVEDLHGVQVADPYRWLEDDVRKSKQAAEWVEAQNSVTFAYLKGIPQRKAIKKLITDLWNYEKVSAPFKEGGRYFYFRNDGLQNQSVLYTAEKADGEGRVLLDPNKLSKDGTVALSDAEVSPDGKLAAVSLSEAGSDWHTVKVLDVATGKFQDDELKWIKFSGLSWTSDSKGFFYSRYDEPKKVDGKFTSVNKFMKVFYHKVGAKQADDELVHKDDKNPDWGFSARATEDGKYLILTTRKGTDARHRLAYKEIGKGGGFTQLVSVFANEYSFIDNVGTVFYFKTDKAAPRGRIVSLDVSKPEKERLKEVVPQAKEKLSGVNLVGGQFICSYLKDAHSAVRCYTPEGKLVREVALPGIGSASGFGGKRKQNETFYTFHSFAVPPTIYRYNVKTGASKVFRESKVKFDPSRYTTDQVFYKSKDQGKRITVYPM